MLKLHLGDLVKEHFFHVVSNEFKIREDGVIKRDLLVQVKANTGYGERNMRISLNKYH